MNNQSKSKEELISELQGILQENNSLKALKEKEEAEFLVANKELVFQNEEKEKRADELIIASKELAFQNNEKGKRADELIIANKELAFQNGEKEKRAAELIIANKELAFQNEEKGKRATELIIANKELAFQNEEKGKRATELIIANKELAFQNGEKEKRAAELIIANKELAFQNGEKEKRAAELIIVNKELAAVASEKYTELFNFAPSGYFILSPKGVILELNLAGAEMLGKERSKLKNAVFSLLVSPYSKSGFVLFLTKVFENKNKESCEVLLQIDDNLPMYVFLSGRIVAENENQCFITAIDITDRKLAEKALVHHNDAMLKLNHFSLGLTKLPSKDNLEAFIIKQIKEFSGAKVGVFSEYNAASRTTTIKHIEMETGLLKKVVSLLGKQVNEIHGVVSDEMYQEIMKERIGTKATLHEASFGAISRTAGAVIQTLLKVDRFIGLAFIVDGRLYGTSLLAMKKGQPDPPKEILENYTFLAAMSMRRKQAEVELIIAKENAEESEDKYRRLVNEVNDGFYITDNQGIITLSNNALAKILGFNAPEELNGHNFMEFVHPDAINIVNDRFRLDDENKNSLDSYEVKARKVTGQTIFLEITTAQIMDDNVVLGFRGVIRDVTERKMANEALTYERNLLKAFMDYSLDNIYFKDRESHFIRINKALINTFGISDPEQAIGKTDFDFFTDEHARPAYEAEQEIIKTGQSLVGLEEKETWLNGRVKWVSTSKMPLPDMKGEIVGTFGISRDITEHKQAEEKLKESEEKSRTLFQNHSAIKLIIDSDNGNIVDANFAAAKFYGWPVEKLKTMNMSEINTLSPAETKKLMNSAKNNVKNYFEFKHRKADGSIWDVGIDCGIITYKGKRYLHLIVRNITEYKKLEEERKQGLEKLRAFATMLQNNREEERKSIAREIHDEFGQVLTAIKMNLTMLGKETTKTVESSTATFILSEIDNMKQIINQTIHKVRVFTNNLRPDVLDTFGLFEALDTHISEFDKLHGIKCNFVMPDEEIEIDSDKSIAVYRIVQEALTNVTRHAKATEVDISISKQDNFLNVSIEDNGKGIERTQLDDAKSFGIIGMKERAYICGGTLLLTSEPGKGTKIDLSMPIKEND